MTLPPWISPSVKIWKTCPNRLDMGEGYRSTVAAQQHVGGSDTASHPREFQGHSSGYPSANSSSCSIVSAYSTANSSITVRTDFTWFIDPTICPTK